MTGPIGSPPPTTAPAPLPFFPVQEAGPQPQYDFVTMIPPDGATSPEITVHDNVLFFPPGNFTTCVNLSRDGLVNPDGSVSTYAVNLADGGSYNITFNGTATDASRAPAVSIYLPGSESDYEVRHENGRTVLTNNDGIVLTYGTAVFGVDGRPQHDFGTGLLPVFMGDMPAGEVWVPMNPAPVPLVSGDS